MLRIGGSFFLFSTSEIVTHLRMLRLKWQKRSTLGRYTLQCFSAPLLTAQLRSYLRLVTSTCCGVGSRKHTSARDAAYVNFDLLHLQMLLLEADWLVLPGGKLEKGPVWVSVEGQKITGVFKDRAPPTTDYTIHHAHLVAPGFVDIHTHGVGESSG